jgi:hypothetical protein
MLGLASATHAEPALRRQTPVLSLSHRRRWKKEMNTEVFLRPATNAATGAPTPESFLYCSVATLLGNSMLN